MRKILVTSYTLLRLKNLKRIKLPGVHKTIQGDNIRRRKSYGNNSFLEKKSFSNFLGPTWIHNFCLYTITILLFFCLCYERDECF